MATLKYAFISAFVDKDCKEIIAGIERIRGEYYVTFNPYSSPCPSGKFNSLDAAEKQVARLRPTAKKWKYMEEHMKLYNDLIVRHNQEPRHRGHLKGSLIAHGANAACGDELTLQLCVKDGKIADGAFHGEGCAISQASADIMLDLIIGQTTDTAKKLSAQFHGLISGDIEQSEWDALGDAAAFRPVAKMPARKKCALLAWNTLDKMI